MCDASRTSTEFLEVMPKLVDFGVATSDDIRVTRTGDVVGTPAYMAPEQARGDAPIDARCDIYSLGATLFELIADRPPHVGPTLIATLARLVTTSPPRLRELKRNVPPMLDNLVHRMLSSDPMDRPGSAQEVAETLRMLLRQSPTANVLESMEPVVSNRLGSSASRLVTSIVAIGFASGSARDLAIQMLRESDADAVPLGHDSIVAHLGARFAVGTEASVALDLGRRLAKSGARVGVASGRARVNLSAPSGDVQPIGEVMDRASALARDATLGTLLADATTSELGRGRHEFRSRDDGSAIVGDALRGLRGDRMGGAPFVGRDAELAQVSSAFERTTGDQTPIVVSITGPPGIGKSRLRREVLARLTARADAPRGRSATQRGLRQEPGPRRGDRRGPRAAQSAERRVRRGIGGGDHRPARTGDAERSDVAEPPDRRAPAVGRGAAARLGSPRHEGSALVGHDGPRAPGRGVRADRHRHRGSPVGGSGERGLARSLDRSRGKPLDHGARLDAPELLDGSPGSVHRQRPRAARASPDLEARVANHRQVLPRRGSDRRGARPDRGAGRGLTAVRRGTVTPRRRRRRHGARADDRSRDPGEPRFAQRGLARRHRAALGVRSHGLGRGARGARHGRRREATPGSCDRRNLDRAERFSVSELTRVDVQTFAVPGRHLFVARGARTKGAARARRGLARVHGRRRLRRSPAITTSEGKSRRRLFTGRAPRAAPSPRTRFATRS